MIAYSCSALFVVMLTANRPPPTAVTSVPIASLMPNSRASRGGESICARSTRRPLRAAARARAAANVVRPTPPLPDTTTNRRSSSDLAASMSEVVAQPEAGGEAIAEYLQAAAIVGREGWGAEEAGVVEIRAHAQPRPRQRDVG